MNMKVAIVYDRVNKWGGAERVLLALNEIFPRADLFTSVFHPKKANWAKVFPKVQTSFLNKFKFTRDKHRILATLMPLAFESFDFSLYDLVISVSSEAAKSVITGPVTKHISYILTPTRYLWSGTDIYFENKFLMKISRPIIKYLKRWDGIVSKRADTLVAISSEVQSRIKKYYNVSSPIVYPPVDFSLLGFVNRKSSKTGKYYLLVSRLEKYKKVDLAIEAFGKFKRPLVIVGTGSEKPKLRRLASKNIKLVGFVSEKRLANYYQNCKALIFPQEEDFGITALEAQMFGKPVIAYKKGGALDTVIDGKTGFFFEEQTPESLVKIVKMFESTGHKKINPKVCYLNAKRFSKAEFKKSFKKLLGEL